MNLQSSKSQKLLRKIQHENEKLNKIVLDFKKQLEDVRLVSFNRTAQLQTVDETANQILQELKIENKNLEQISYLINFQIEKNKKLSKIRQIAAIQNKMLETLLKANDEHNRATATEYVETTTKSKEFQCHRDGLFGESRTNCSHFFVCNWTNTQHSMKSRLSCPIGTIFNPKLRVCDWKNSNTIIC